MTRDSRLTREHDSTVSCNLYSTCSSASHLVGRQTIDLYVHASTYFLYSTQYPAVVILGNARTHTHAHYEIKRE